MNHRKASSSSTHPTDFMGVQRLKTKLLKHYKQKEVDSVVYSLLQHGFTHNNVYQWMLEGETLAQKFSMKTKQKAVLFQIVVMFHSDILLYLVRIGPPPTHTLLQSMLDPDGILCEQLRQSFVLAELVTCKPMYYPDDWKILQIWRPLLKLSHVTTLIRDFAMEYKNESLQDIQQKYETRLKQRDSLLSALKIFLKDGNHLVMPKNVFETDAFEELVFYFLIHSSQVAVLKDLVDVIFPAHLKWKHWNDDVKNRIFCMFLHVLNERYANRRINTFEEFSKEISNFVTLLNITQTNGFPILFICMGRWNHCVVDLLNRFKHLATKEQMKVVFHSELVTRDIPHYYHCISFLIRNYEIDPFEVVDNENIIYKLLQIEHSPFSIQMLLLPIIETLGLKKLSLNAISSSLNTEDQIRVALQSKLFSYGNEILRLNLTFVNTYLDPIVFDGEVILERLYTMLDMGYIGIDLYNCLLNHCKIKWNQADEIGNSYNSLHEYVMMRHEEEYQETKKKAQSDQKLLLLDSTNPVSVYVYCEKILTTNIKNNMVATC
ncbi:hypothetical protein C9374_006486 [Naegleria lovaniensis]|uniref:Uncharacterized protein n=1 Tax=Naegleria lovaniensis TaxID=51637 RepID=A0AA88KHU2_NAELO|nr:uncharacterized protein C9374_006486 [Naegleria lovaniensis]KAG2381497.1 hypothetical protein C9374_006486 [Naegleria lovaniensis]